MKYLILILGILVFCSCEERLNGFETSLNADITINNGVELDSIKIGTKTGSNIYPVTVSTSNLSDIKSIDFRVEEGDISILNENGEEIDKLPKSNSINLKVQFNSPQTTTIVFTITDNLGEVVERDLRIKVFGNIPPEAVLKLNKVGENDPNEIEINAFESFDRDSEFGGAIEGYEYKVDGLTLTRTEASIRYIFSSSGTKVVRLRVVDNDGDWSEEVIETIDL